RRRSLSFWEVLRHREESNSERLIRFTSSRWIDTTALLLSRSPSSDLSIPANRRIAFLFLERASIDCQRLLGNRPSEWFCEYYSPCNAEQRARHSGPAQDSVAPDREGYGPAAAPT